MAWIWHQTQLAALPFNSTGYLFSPDHFSTNAFRSIGSLIRIKVAALIPGTTLESVFKRAQTTQWRWEQIFQRNLSFLLFPVLALCSCASECVTRRQLQRIAIVTGQVSPFPHLGNIQQASLRLTSNLKTYYLSLKSLHRSPCSIKLINNTDRDCYASVMTQFDEENK